MGRVPRRTSRKPTVVGLDAYLSESAIGSSSWLTKEVSMATETPHYYYLMIRCQSREELTDFLNRVIGKRTWACGKTSHGADVGCFKFQVGVVVQSAEKAALVRLFL